MDLHQNARLTWRSREALARSVVIKRLALNAAAAAFKVSPKTAAKWVRRYREQGREGLLDRSSCPHRSPRRTPGEVVAQVLVLRRQRWTGVRIAQTTALSRATVSRILRRQQLSRMRDLEPAVPIVRYEHPHPGDLLHLDTKKLARIAKPGHRLTGDPRDETRGVGWEMLHIAIDDHSRIAFSQFHPDERASSSVAFLRAAVAYYARLGIRIRRGSPTTLPAITRSCLLPPAANSAFAISAPAPTRRAPTARPNVSSRPPCANGLTPTFIKTQLTGTPNSNLGCISTTGTDRMLVWASRHLSAAPALMGTTS